MIKKTLVILWRSPLYPLLFLAAHSTKEPAFDWFESHSTLFWYQQPDHQVRFDYDCDVIFKVFRCTADNSCPSNNSSIEESQITS